MELELNPLLDVKYLKQVYGDDHNIMHLIFDAFITDSLPRWRNLEDVIDQQNLIEAASIVHGLKPSFTMTGLTALRSPVEELEQLIKNQASKEKQVRLYHHITQELDKLIPVLSSESERLGAM